MSMLNVFNIAGSAMNAQSVRLNTTASTSLKRKATGCPSCCATRASQTAGITRREAKPATVACIRTIGRSVITPIACLKHKATCAATVRSSVVAR